MPEVVFSSCPFNRPSRPSKIHCAFKERPPPPSLRVLCLYRHKLRLLAMGVVVVNISPARNSSRGETNDKIAARNVRRRKGGRGSVSFICLTLPKSKKPPPPPPRSCEDMATKLLLALAVVFLSCQVIKMHYGKIDQISFFIPDA